MNVQAHQCALALPHAAVAQGHQDLGQTPGTMSMLMNFMRDPHALQMAQQSARAVDDIRIYGRGSDASSPGQAVNRMGSESSDYLEGRCAQGSPTSERGDTVQPSSSPHQLPSSSPHQLPSSSPHQLPSSSPHQLVHHAPLQAASFSLGASSFVLQDQPRHSPEKQRKSIAELEEETYQALNARHTKKKKGSQAPALLQDVEDGSDVEQADSESDDGPAAPVVAKKPVGKLHKAAKPPPKAAKPVALTIKRPAAVTRVKGATAAIEGAARTPPTATAKVVAKQPTVAASPDLKLLKVVVAKAVLKRTTKNLIANSHYHRSRNAAMSKGYSKEVSAAYARAQYQRAVTMWEDLGGL